MKRFHLLLTAVISIGACEAPRTANSLSTETPPDASTPSSPSDAPAAEPLLHVTELATDPDDRRVAILLHGYGSNEFDLIPLARRLGLRGPVESFVAPYPAGRGHAWFGIDFSAPPESRYDLTQFEISIERAAVSLRELGATHAGHELVLVGFSQGAMMTMALAARHPETFDRGVAIAGALPDDLEFVDGARPSLLLAHGTADRVVGHERGLEARETLQRGGVPVTFQSYPGTGHAVAPAMIEDAARWLEQAR